MTLTFFKIFDYLIRYKRMTFVVRVQSVGGVLVSAIGQRFIEPVVIKVYHIKSERADDLFHCGDVFRKRSALFVTGFAFAENADWYSVTGTTFLSREIKHSKHPCVTLSPKKTSFIILDVSNKKSVQLIFVKIMMWKCLNKLISEFTTN